jgi:hypothetical protein
MNEHPAVTDLSLPHPPCQAWSVGRHDLVLSSRNPGAEGETRCFTDLSLPPPPKTSVTDLLNTSG